MKILIVTENFYPETNAPANRLYDTIRSWIENENDLDVTVLTTAPNHNNNNKVYSGYKNKIYFKEQIEGITVIRVWSYIPKLDGFVFKTLDFISFFITSFITGLFLKFDIIITTTPQFFTSFTGFLLSKLKRKKWVLEVRDLWPDTFIAVGIFNKEDFAYKVLKLLEYYIYKYSDKIITVTNGIKSSIVNTGVSTDKVETIYNGIAYDEYLKKYVVPKKKMKDSFHVVYVGTIGLTQGLETIVEAIGELKPEEKVVFNIAGDGAKKNDILNYINKRKLNNINLLGYLNKKEVYNLYSKSHLSVVPLKDSKLFDGAIPSKIFDSAISSTPIMLGVKGEAKEIITKSNAGVYFKPENKSDFKAKLIQLKNDSRKINKLENGALSLAKKFDRTELSKKYFRILTELISNKK